MLIKFGGDDGEIRVEGQRWVTPQTELASAAFCEVFQNAGDEGTKTAKDGY